MQEMKVYVLLSVLVVLEFGRRMTNLFLAYKHPPEWNEGKWAVKTSFFFVFRYFVVYFFLHIFLCLDNAFMPFLITHGITGLKFYVGRIGDDDDKNNHQHTKIVATGWYSTSISRAVTSPSWRDRCVRTFSQFTFF